MCLKTKEMGEKKKRKHISRGEDDVVQLPGGEVDILSASGRAILWSHGTGRLGSSLEVEKTPLGPNRSMKCWCEKLSFQ